MLVATGITLIFLKIQITIQPWCLGTQKVTYFVLIKMGSYNLIWLKSWCGHPMVWLIQRLLEMAWSIQMVLRLLLRTLSILGNVWLILLQLLSMLTSLQILTLLMLQTLLLVIRALMNWVLRLRKIKLSLPCQILLHNSKVFCHSQTLSHNIRNL